MDVFIILVSSSHFCNPQGWPLNTSLTVQKIYILYYLFNLATFPIDTTKTRLQLQGQHIDTVNKEIKYRGMLSAFVKISNEEGLRALYNGWAIFNCVEKSHSCWQRKVNSLHNIMCICACTCMYGYRRPVCLCIFLTFYMYLSLHICR